MSHARAIPTTKRIGLVEASEHTGLSVKTLRRRIADGTLPAFRAGRLVKVTVSDLDLLFQPIPSVRNESPSGAAL